MGVLGDEGAGAGGGGGGGGTSSVKGEDWAGVEI